MGRGGGTQQDTIITPARSTLPAKKLTIAQESTLLSLGYCSEQRIDSTREISANDQYAQERLEEKRSGGTTQRLKALEKKGLAEIVNVFWSGESTWCITEAGKEIYEQLKKERFNDPDAVQSQYRLPVEHHWVKRRLSSSKSV